MLKKRVFAFVAAIAIMFAAAGGTIVADSFGFSITPEAAACSGDGHGGGC